MRKGETGDWRTKLSDEQVKIIHLVYIDYSNGFEIDADFDVHLDLMLIFIVQLILILSLIFS